MKRAILPIAAALFAAGLTLYLALHARTPTVDAPPLPDASLAMDKEVRDAINAAHASVLKQPGDAQKRGELAMLFDAAHLYREAAVTYAQTITLDSNNAKWWYHLARMRQELGDTAGAMEAVNRAGALDPNQFVIPLRRGMWQIEAGDIAQADASFRHALKLKPDSIAAKFGLARALVMQDQFAPAAQLLEQLRLAIPTDSTVRQLLGRCYLRMNRPVEGNAEMTLGVASKWDWRVEDEWLAEVRAMRRGYRAQFETASALVNAGESARAIQILEALRVQNPDDLSVVLLLSKAFDEANQVDRGLDVLLQMDARRPDHFAIKLNLGHFYELKGDFGRAMRFTNDAITLHPLLSAAHVQKARLYLTQQDYVAAEESADEAVRCDANDPQARYVKAQTQMAQNRYQDALIVLTQATRTHPYIAQGFAMLAACQYTLGKRTEALASLAQGERLNPNDPTVKYVRLGITQAQAGQGSR